MCVIICLKKKQMIDKEMLYNACHNNWHSFGLVTKVDGKLDIHRELPTNGEVDPEKVYGLLQDDFEYERFLHVRYNTAGATTLENTHPFDVYYDEKTGEQVVFMHNGTLYEYKSKKQGTVTGSFIDDDDGPSDSKNFTDRILIPYVAADFGTGPGDIHNPLFTKLINRFWPSTGSNRGLLISSKKQPLVIGDWKSVGDEGNKILVSNDDYFDKVIRGPENERRRLREEEEKRIREEKAKKNTVKSSFINFSTPSNIVGITKLQDVKVNQPVNDYFALSESLKNVLDDWDVWDRKGMTALGFCTHDELKALYKDENSCVMLMDAVFTEFAKMYDDLEKSEKKLEKASQHIEQMALKLKNKKAA